MARLMTDYENRNAMAMIPSASVAQIIVPHVGRRSIQMSIRNEEMMQTTEVIGIVTEVRQDERSGESVATVLLRDARVVDDERRRPRVSAKAKTSTPTSKKETTMKKYNVTAILDRKTKTVDLHVEVLLNGESRMPEAYLLPSGEKMARSDNTAMPVFHSFDVGLAESIALAIQREIDNIGRRL